MPAPPVNRQLFLDQEEQRRWESLNDSLKTNTKEAEALLRSIKEPTPIKPPGLRRASSPTSVVDFPPPPPAPRKLRRERADEIVECAMKLMDLAMDQNRRIKRLEECIKDNYSEF